MVGSAVSKARSHNLTALWSSFRWLYLGCLIKPITLARLLLNHIWVTSLTNWLINYLIMSKQLIEWNSSVWRYGLKSFTIFINWSIIIIAGSNERATSSSSKVCSSMVLWKRIRLQVGMNQVIANKVLKDSLDKIMINVLVDEAHVKQAH